ncbi:MAG: S8/S53 family peptidase [Bacilli bacterium]|nr:S8/S53 family peptidase [Bacilli bacterium]
MRNFRFILISVILATLIFVKNGNIYDKILCEYKEGEQSFVVPMKEKHLDYFLNSKEDIRLTIIFGDSSTNMNDKDKDDYETYFEQSNSLNFSSLDIEYSNVFVSKYTPFVFCVLKNKPKQEITSIMQKLSESEIVSVVYIGESIEKSADDIKINVFDNDINSYETQMTDLRNIPYDNFPNGTTLSGLDVKIGVLDIGIFDTLHPNFAEIDVYNLTQDFDGDYESDDLHPTFVASILGGKYGIANKASIYFSDIKSEEGFGAIEKLISADVDVINMSVSLGDSAIDEWFSCPDFLYMECIVDAYNIILVAAAGSRLNVLNAPGNVAQPANTTTVISVGSIKQSGMPSNFSNYRRYNYFQISKSKPEIVAVGEDRIVPGLGTISGTSFSAPAVSGTIALLIEKHGDLINPQSALALLLASSSNNVNTGQTIINGDIVTNSKKSGGDLRERTGAGRLDIKAVLDISSSNIRINLDNISDNFYEDIYIESGDEVKISMVWNRTFTPYDWFDNHVWGEDDLPELSPFTNVDLFLKNGTEVITSSTYRYSNIQFIRTTVNQSRTYNISSSGWENAPIGSQLNYAIYIKHNCKNPIQYNAIYHLYSCCNILERHTLYYSNGQFICSICGYVQKTPPIEPEEYKNTNKHICDKGD